MIMTLLLLCQLAATGPVQDALGPTGVDVDGDGCADVALMGPVWVHVLSGASGTEVARVAPAEELRPHDDEARWRGRVDVAVSLVRDSAEGAVRLLGVREDGSVAVQTLQETANEVEFEVRLEGFPRLVRRIEERGSPDGGYLVADQNGVHRLAGKERRWSIAVDATDLAVLDDVDADGVRDFAVVEHDDTATGNPGGPATVRSGRDGSLLLRIASRCSSTGMVGDVDGDGVADLALGFPYAAGCGLRVDDVSDGAVRVYSTADGRELYALSNPSDFDPFTRFGARIVYLGDVDNDQVGDFAVGAHKDDPVESQFETGSVTVFSGRNGTRIHKLFGPASSSWFSMFEPGLTSPGDLDGDGAADLLITSIHEGAERVLVSGRTGAVLWVATFGEGTLQVSKDWAAAPLPGHPKGVSWLRRTRG